jgi:two-component system, OmpR family, response regulator
VVPIEEGPFKRAVDVLVVDDDEDVRSSLAEILKVSGFSVEVAEDGDVALRLIDELSIGMVILDLRMPRCDGFSVIDALQDPPPIVLMSAYAFDSSMRERVGSKVIGHFQKPVAAHKLLPVVAGVVWRSSE